MRSPVPCSLVAAVCVVVASAAPSLAAAPSAITEAQAAEYDLDPAFFKKGLMVQDILIATSDKVSDYAILESAYLFDHMMKSIAAPVAARIREKKVLCILVGHDELTSDIPQFASDKTGKDLDFYNWRQRGFLTRVKGRSVVLFAEEDVLEYEGGMQIESILIHEFGHVIHGAGFDDDQQKAAQRGLRQGQSPQHLERWPRGATLPPRHRRRACEPA